MTHLHTPSQVMRLINAVLDVGVEHVGLAGTGSCFHAPGASGNVATEDLACMFAKSLVTV